jgi:hypothetical protein
MTLGVLLLAGWAWPAGTGASQAKPPAPPAPQPSPATAAKPQTTAPAQATPPPQQPPPPGAPPPAPSPGAQPPAPPPPLAQDPYTYGGVGRRDPFVSLLGRGTDARGQSSRPAGVAGLLVNEVSVRGIVQTAKGYVALIQGPDNRSYMVRPHDRLLDGTVKAIMKDQVIFSQEVNDPLSLIKVKEVPKRIREEGK